jgi:NAD-dependent dihydropyrimidine dehydrogenase PreA subunit
MKGNGPRHRALRHLGLILSCSSGLALDFVIADLVGFDPLQIPSIRNAADRGLGFAGIDEVESLGNANGNIRYTDFLPPVVHTLCYVPEFFLSAAQQPAAARPVIDPSRCRACGVCVKNCPAHAIRVRRNTPVVSSYHCIWCFCCQELCLANAVTVRFSLLRRMLRR